MFNINFKLLTLIAWSCSCPLWAQGISEHTLQLPVTNPPLLSGNFAELRTNHFHGGLDFKTEGQIRLPIRSVEDGWISRVVVSPSGYGNALFIDHYNGMTSVYAHLEEFKGEIAQAVKEIQTEKESFALDENFPKEQFKISKGDLIALSGNTGASGGPHLHFELRDTESNISIDPLHYYKDKIKDTRAPELRMLRLYPLDSAVINNHQRSLNLFPTLNAEKKPIFKQEVNAWGNIILGVKTYDRMNDVYHIYGVKSVRMFVDDTLHFAIKYDDIPLEDTRYMNSLIDYNDWTNNRSMVTRLYQAPGNLLDIYTRATNQGIISINEPRVYQIRLELSDIYGNQTISHLDILGKPAPLKAKTTTADQLFRYDQDNLYQTPELTIKLDKGLLYEDLEFSHQTHDEPKGYSLRHSIHNNSTPIHNYGEIKVKIETDTLKNKKQYYLARKIYNRYYNTSAVYHEGYMKGRFRDFGDYVVLADKQKPSIRPTASPAAWKKYGSMRFVIDDLGSGIQSIRGEIDGQWVLFKYDAKYKVISHVIDPKRTKRNQKHQLKLIVTDATGNEAVYQKEFLF